MSEHGTSKTPVCRTPVSAVAIARLRVQVRQRLRVDDDPADTFRDVDRAERSSHAYGVPGVSAAAEVQSTGSSRCPAIGSLIDLEGSNIARIESTARSNRCIGSTVRC